MLREQLDQATAANQTLTADIRRLTQDWQRARDDLEEKEMIWRDEEQVRGGGGGGKRQGEGGRGEGVRGGGGRRRKGGRRGGGSWGLFY